jgi:2,4-dienoyl-CoA reductase-like NADH-dependent reductase (Old Yellow Enzyme family)
MTSLADSLTLPCGAVLPNRIAKGAMTEGLADPWNRATARHATLYKRWAEGGLGLSLTGNIMVDRRYLERAGNVAIEGEQDAEAMAALRAYAEAGKSAGGAIWVQLSHAGRQAQKSTQTEPVAPSAVGEVALPGGRFGKPRALSGDEIRDVIARFAHAAGVVKEAGFDGVQIHSAHGYLLSEFLSPLINKREDEWGGDIEGRSRLLIETIAAVREKVGPGFPVAVKLNSSDFQKGGYSFEDCIEVVKRLETTSIDLLEISGGNYEQPSMMGIEGMEPVYEDGEFVKETTRAREAYFLNYAGAIRENFTKPLMVTGGFRSRAAMERALTEEGVSVIGIARPVCVEPDAPKALLDGSMDTLRSWEKEQALGPGWFGPASSNQMMRAMNGFANMAFFYRNIIRMAAALNPKRKMNLLGALIAHEQQEAKDAKALRGR